MSRPRVLVIDEALPFPTDSGKRIRTFELLRRLADGMDITFAYHREGPDDPAAVEAMADAGIALRPVDRAPLRKQGLRFAWDLGRNLLLPVPYMVMAHRTAAMRRLVAGELDRGAYDVVHAEWTPLLANVPGDGGAAVSVAAHNVETRIWERYLENESNLARRAYIAGQVAKVRRFEQDAFRRAHAVMTVSPEDAALAAAWSGRDDIEVVPNGVDAGFFAPRPDAAVRPHELVFVGSLDWRPNLDGVSWFLDACWSRIRAARPETTFTVVGRNPPAWLAERLDATPGVTLAGGVPDVRPYVARAAINLVPLRIGGGSRLKICEALAMQRPVVSTSIGAEGLALDGGLTRADGDDAFAAAVLAALDDPDAQAVQARHGRALVLERYTWDRIAPRQARIWERLAARRAVA